MSNIKQEVRDCMSEYSEVEPDKASAVFVFPPDFGGFDGHFPFRAILPGVCITQCVLVMAEKMLGRPVTMQAIDRAKFFAPVTSNEKLAITCTQQARDDGQILLKVNATCDDKKISQLRLIIS